MSRKQMPEQVEEAVAAPRAAACQHPTNRGMELDLGWVMDCHVDLSALEDRAGTIPKRRTVKKLTQAAWLLKAISCIDLTTLAGDDSHDR